MKNKIGILAIALLLAIPFCVFSKNTVKKDAKEYLAKDSIARKGWTLIFINKDPSFNPEIATKLKETFFTVYPALVKRFNKKSADKVVFVIDPEYKGVAATSNDKVVFNPLWFKDHPGDIDVVTHEVMHIVQAYGNTPGPGWLTEGIADYVRYRYGVDPEGSNWKLPEVKQGQHYTNSYRITARFLVWMEQHKDKKIVDRLDVIMRNHTYQDRTWEELSGKTIDELWNEYVLNPAIKS